MKINKNGVLFEYHGDEILWLWPWKRRGTEKYISTIFTGSSFDNLREYWEFVGSWNEACRKRKVIGYSEDDVFTEWATISFKHSVVLILRHINVEMKSTGFWKSLDVLSRKELLKDCPVLFFYDVRDAEKVLRSIPQEFAEAYLFNKGFLVADNDESNTG